MVVDRKTDSLIINITKTTWVNTVSQQRA